MRLSDEEAAALVKRAAAGDRGAWEALVAAYSGLIWTIARNHRLRQGDAADVSQTTWLRLLEHIDRLKDPARVGAWLATTARRESLRIQARSRRTLLVADQAELEPARDGDARTEGVDRDLLRAERDDALQEAIATLPTRSQDLIRMLMLEPAPSYEEVSIALGMPIGSIGPTRGRCLAKLREAMEDVGIDAEYARAH